MRRPLRRGGDSEDVPATGSGELEVAELEQSPADPVRAQVLSTVLAVRAALDADFHADLERWHEQARQVHDGGGEVRNNEVSGGTFYGQAVQGRDFFAASFTTPPPVAGSGLDETTPKG